MQLDNDIKREILAAMKAKDQGRLRGLRAIKAAIQLARTEKGAQGELSDEAGVRILQKLVKQRRESMEIYAAQGRDDLLAKEQEEVDVIESFLPAQMDGDELRAVLARIIEDEGAESMRDMGRVMGRASKELAGRADGKLMAEMVKDLLS